MSSVPEQTPDSAATHDAKDTSDAQWQEQQQQKQQDLPSTTQNTSQIVQTDPDAAQNDGQQPTTPLTPAADDAPALPNNKQLLSDADSSSSLSPAPSSPSAASASVQKPDVLASPADDAKPETSTDPAVGESKEHGDITRERPHAISAPQPDSDSQALNPKQGAAQVNGDPVPSTDRPSSNPEHTSPDSVSDVDGAAKVDAVLELNFELGR